ncbi:hypothetical protein KIN20_017721 [Parelaphostrongylus tenuis]|uniref:Uncharacterized protein n=1 Tax=Parelaphostrongylus tenuis TaxID=148309 RepID=A0AAD5N159_PARTN|nr:hypothetical protein KIN20_017276 [Parelaphostrongylus tenuis]KAJ1359092.1 hypothetical protein KIN20_017721 [Parelaphostrongylus tenuis]
MVAPLMPDSAASSWTKSTKLTERFVEKVGVIIATFSGDPHPVETMHATIKSWPAADVEDEMNNESREKALHVHFVELGSGQ